MQTTDIAWCDYTWNPVTGCSHAGPECWHCWAERFMHRQAARDDAPDYMTSQDWTQANADAVVTTHADRLDEPATYHYPRGPGRVFVVSMGDLFHREVGPRFVQDVLDVVAAHPEHVWILLTKRPHNAADWRLEWPDNVWLGTSVGSGPGGTFPNTTHRIEQLRDIDVATKWVSFEPLIEPVGEVALEHIDWVVVGGESAPDDERRELDHAWARDILRQCRAQDVAFFFKQSSAPGPEQGTRLTVEADGGYLVQQAIREIPELPAVTRRARRVADSTANEPTANSTGNPP